MRKRVSTNGPSFNASAYYTLPDKHLRRSMDCLRPCLDSIQLSVLGLWRQWLPSSVSGEEDVVINRRRFRVIRLLGEGGYSFVHLVKEVPTTGRPSVPSTEYALKKCLAVSGEQLAAAKEEVEVMKRLHHPSLLPLLGSATVTVEDDADGTKHAVYMLFPLYSLGSLVDEAERLGKLGRSFAADEILDIFLQVCLGVQAMHQMVPKMAHRDIKPHNVLLERRVAGAAEFDAEDAPLQGQPSPATASTSSYWAVLMDFGSTRAALVEVGSRAQALALQEEAERHCSAPYRAPELFDVASKCTIDERVDIWSLGCTLYHMMYGVSPFERVLNEAGGSLMLAVINGTITWPEQPTYPEEMRDLVSFCLNVDAATRPYIDDVINRVKALQEFINGNLT